VQIRCDSSILTRPRAKRCNEFEEGPEEGGGEWGGGAGKKEWFGGVGYVKGVSMK